MYLKQVFEKKLGIRFFKSVLLLCAASLLTIIFVGNVFLYDINFEYVKHIMSMDDTFHHQKLMLRAVNNPIYYHLAYLAIIILEGLASLFLWIGVYQLFKNITQSANRFNQAKYFGMMGLLFTLVIFIFIFFGIAGEWFASWQSNKWNSKGATMPFVLIFGIIYLILSQVEIDEERTGLS